MIVSAVDLYNITGTNADSYTLLPVTSNLDGEYKGETIVNIILGLLLKVYFDTESKGKLETIYNTNNWARIRNVFKSIREDDAELVEYSILLCSEKDYIKVDFYDGSRYFLLTEKCMNLDLYKYKS
ncbi:hypothetical protein ACQKL6_15045 [Peribacillus sp. NPDC097197]|uniref:hypothetical protein n=1 Tax=Peribacillus sp. NPDC097197 TaxID=3390615 RepID=UPI003D04068D